MSNKPVKKDRRVPQRGGPQYRVTALSYIDGRLVGPGTDIDTIYYDGVPGSALEPLNDLAVEAKAKALAAKKRRTSVLADEERTAELDRLNKQAEELAAERAKLEKERADFEAAKLAAAASAPQGQRK